MSKRRATFHSLSLSESFSWEPKPRKEAIRKTPKPMNTNRSILLRAALRTLAVSAMPVAVHAQNVISLNFTDGGSAPGSTISAGTPGAIPITANRWTNLNSTNGDGTAANLIDNTGAPTTTGINWISANTWRSGGTTVNGNGQLTKGYLDDGSGGCQITLSGIPYLSYNAYIIVGTDQGGGTQGNANYRPVRVNGIPWSHNDTATVQADANWTGQNWTDGASLVEGQNYLKVPNLGGLTLSVTGGNNSGGFRGPIAGIQIENSYNGIFSYWDINGTTAGAGGATPAGTWSGSAANWNSNAAGTGVTAPWAGAGHTAVFAAGADATGSYTVNISGTQTADAVITEQGNINLSGGTLNLAAPAVLRAGTGASLSINTTLTGTSGVVLEGASDISISGAHTVSGAAVVSIPSLILNSGTSFPSLGGLIVGNNVTMIADSSSMTTTGAMSAGNGAQINSAGTALSIGGNINFTGSGYSGSGASTLTGRGLFLNMGTVDSSVALTNTSAITLTGVGTAQATMEFNGGSVSLLDSSNITTDRFVNRGNGRPHALTIGGSAQLNVTDDLVLGDNTNAAITVTQNGGTVTNIGTTNNPGGNDMSNRWGHWGGGTTVYNLSAGTLNLTGAPLYLSWDSGATLNVGGSGIANLRGVDMGFGGRTNAAAINLNGARINIGAAGIITGGTANKTINLNGGTLGSLATWTGTVPMNVLAATTLDTAGGSMQLNGALSGTGGLTIQGGGTVGLGGVNTYTGATTVTGNSRVLFGQGGANASVITVQPGSSFGAGSLTTSGIGAANNVISQNGAGSSFRVGPVNSDMVDLLDLNVTGTHTLTVTPTGLLAPNTVFTVIDYATLSGAGYAGINVVSSTPRAVITKEADNGSSIDVKVVSFDALVWKGTAPGNPNLWDLNTTQNWQTTATNVATTFQQNDILTFNDTAATGNITLSGTLSPASMEFDNSTVPYVLSGSGTLTGNTGITKDGTALLELGNASNTYTGPTTIIDGILRIGNGTTGALPAGGALIMDGGEVQVNTAPGSTFANPVTMNAGTLAFKGTGDLAFSAPINIGAGNLYFDRAGTVVRSVQALVTGTITVNSGTFAFDGIQTQNFLPANKLVTVNPGATFEHRGLNAFPTAANAIDVEATDATIRVISGGSAASGAESQSHAHFRNLTLSGSALELGYFGTGGVYNEESFQLNGVIGVTGSTPSVVTTLAGANAANSGIALIAGSVIDVADVTGSPAADLTVNAELETSDANAGSLLKSGTGTLVLNNANSYPGTTTVPEGTLIVNGSLAGGAVTIDPGATLGGNGAIGGTVNITAGATVAPGTSAGDLTVGSTILTGTYQCEIDGTNADTLVVNGDLDLTGGTLNIATLGGGTPLGTYIIASYTGTLTGTFATVTGLPGGYSLNYNAAAKRIEITNGTNAYGSWEAANGITGAGGDADSDSDGIRNGIEFVIGGDPSGPNSDSNSKKPTSTVDTTYLNVTFRRTQESISYNPAIEYGNNLTGWTTAQNGVNGVIITETPNIEPGVDSVLVKIPRSLAAGSKFFARLKVTVP